MEIIKLKYAEIVPENYTGIVEWENGKKEWYKEGLLHREDGPACEYPKGSKYWYKDGLLHREDGPAIECSDGTKHWYKKGKLHREDGPAVESSNGYKEWFIEGIEYFSSEHQLDIKNKIFLKKEKGKYNLYWLSFFTEEGIEEFPIIPGMEKYKMFRILFTF